MRAVRLGLGAASALGLCRFAYGLVLPAMSEDLGWNLTQAGMMTTANGMGYLLGALLTAPTARRLGTPATFRIGLVLCALALAATAVTNAYAVLLLLRALAGVGGALVFVSGAALCPTPTFFAGTGVGIAISGAGLPLLLDQRSDSWPLAWLGLAVVAAVCAVVAWAPASSPPPERVIPKGPPGRARPLWPTAAVYGVFAAGYITYITFLSAYLDDQEASARLTAVTWLLLGLAVVAGTAWWQRPIATWGPGRVLAVLLGNITVAAALALALPTPVALVVSVLVYGVSFMAVPAAVTADIYARSTAEGRVRTLAMLTVVFAVGQAVGPWAAGALADATRSGATLGWTVALCGIGAVIATTLMRPAKPSGPAVSEVGGYRSRGSRRRSRL
jgi:predicted MFS family arabinose efflux permease